MSSSTPLRATDTDSSVPDLRFRSLSVSSSTGASNRVARDTLSRRSETPKAKRKSLSNRSVPYTSPAPLRASQSKPSTITINYDNRELNDRSTLSSIDVNAIQSSSEQNQLNQEPDPFERSDEEQDANKENIQYSNNLSAPNVMENFTKREKNKFLCNTCGELKTTNGSSTFNLRRHLAIKHQMDVRFKLSHQEKKKSYSNRSTVSKERREELDNLLLNCIVHDGLPYNHFSHPWFDALFEKVESGYRAPDRRTFRRRVEDRYRRYIKELKRLIPKDRPIAYTTDVWKSTTRHHYICLTAHVFNDEMKPVSLLLSFRRLTDRKCSRNLNAFIAYELNHFGLSEWSHAGITTDKGSDIKAATEFGDFGPRFPCIGHTFNLIVNHGLCIWNKPNENWYPFKLYKKNTAIIDDDETVDAEEMSNRDRNRIELSNNSIRIDSTDPNFVDFELNTKITESNRT